MSQVAFGKVKKNDEEQSENRKVSPIVPAESSIGPWEAAIMSGKNISISKYTFRVQQ